MAARAPGNLGNRTLIYVVGAFCLDIVAEGNSFLENTSTPGRISVRPGGVAYNIFSHITDEKRLITAVGDDAFSEMIQAFVGAGKSQGRQDISLTKVDAPPPLYVAFMERGELKVAASQMDAVEQALSAEHVLRELKPLDQNDVVVLDANLHHDTLRTIVREIHGRCRVVFEPLSAAKASRHAGYIADLFLMTPDIREFEVLLGKRDVSDSAVFDYMGQRSIENLLATRGREGAVLYCNGERHDFAPEHRLSLSDSTGAGDMLTALVAQAVHRGNTVFGALRGCMREVESMLKTRSEA